MARQTTTATGVATGVTAIALLLLALSPLLAAAIWIPNLPMDPEQQRTDTIMIAKRGKPHVHSAPGGKAALDGSWSFEYVVFDVPGTDDEYDRFDVCEHGEHITGTLPLDEAPNDGWKNLLPPRMDLSVGRGRLRKDCVFERIGHEALNAGDGTVGKISCPGVDYDIMCFAKLHGETVVREWDKWKSCKFKGDKDWKSTKGLLDEEMLKWRDVVRCYYPVEY